MVGIDLDEARVQAVSERRSYLIDVPAQRYDELDGRLRATSDYSAVAELDAVTICVPTPLSKTRTPDISHVISAAEAVAENLRPRSARRAAVDNLPRHHRGDRAADPRAHREGGGEGFLLGYAPERLDPGNATYTLRNTPKLVAGVTDECASSAPSSSSASSSKR